MFKKITKLIKNSKTYPWQPPALIIFTAIIIVVGLIYIFNQPKIVEAEWFNDGWMYRQTVGITNAGTAQTDFQVKITLDTATLITNGKLQSDCDDLRITDINGNILPHWIEDDTCNTASTYIWTKAPSIPTSGATLYLYYGNASAENVANGDNVFEFFDDFSDATKTSGNWTATGTGFTVTGGTLYHSTTLEPTNAFPTYTINSSSGFTNGVIESKMKPASCGSSYGKSVVARYTDDNNLYIAGLEAWTGGYTHIGKRVSGTWTNLDQDALTCSTSTWYAIKWVLNSTSQSLNINGVASTATDSAFSSGKVGVSVDNRETPTGAYWDWFFVRQYAATEPTVASPASEEKGPGPVAYWKFDEGVNNTCAGGTNDVCDSTASGNDGAITGATWQSEDMCVSGKCLYFDGTISNYIQVPTSVIDTLGDYSLSFWVKSVDLAKSINTVIHGTKTGGNDFSLEFKSTVINHYTPGGAYYTWSGLSHSKDTWYHIEVTRSGSICNLYEDGVNRGAVSCGSSVVDISGGCLIIGQEQDGVCGSYDADQALEGYLDEVKIYPYARTAVQVKADYLAGQAGLSSGATASLGGGQQDQGEGLIGYWKMDETSCGPVDSSGNSLTGTCYNSPTVTTAKYANGLSFNDGSQYVDIPATSIAGSNYSTTTLWIKTSSDSYSAIFNAGAIYVAQTATNRIGFDVRQSSGWVDSASGNNTGLYIDDVSVGAWHFIAAVYDGIAGVTNLYLDGILKTTKTYTPNTVNDIKTAVGSTYGTIGRWSSNYSTTVVDDIKVYKTARTAEQIMRDYKQGPGPIEYYNFEEKSTTTAYDRSGNSHNLTATGFDSTNIALGKYGSAYKYGTWTENHLGTSANICGNITLEAWIYPLSTPASDTYTVILNNGTQAAYLSYGPNNSVYTYWYGRSSPGYHSSGASTVPINTWSHIVGVWDDVGAKLYVNGILKNSVASTGTSCTGTVLNIGAENSTRQMNGYIDEVKIYNYARNQEQILDDMYGDATPHPIAYWNLDEGADNTCSGGTKDVCDSSGYGRDGDNTSATWTNDSKFGNGLLFNSSDYVSCGTSTALAFGSGDHSFSAWVKPSALTAAYNYIVAVGNNATGEQSGFGIESDGDLFHSAYSSPLVTFDTSITTGDWYYLALVHSSGVSYVYVNGELAGSQAIATNVTTGKCYLGAHTGAASSFNDGILDEVKIFNFALSPEQIRQEYNRGAQTSLGSAKNSDSIWDDGGFGGVASVGYWNFEEGSGSTLYDRSANSNNGTITTATYTLGKPGWGLDFDGSTNEVYVPYNSALAPTSGVTVEAWVKLGTTAVNNRIVSKTESGGYTLGMNIDGNSDRNFYVYRNGAYGNVGWSSSNFTTDTWYHLVGTYDGRYMKFYVNGQLKDTDDAGATYPITYAYSNGLCIGEEVGSSTCAATSNFDGTIDEVKIFNYARSQAQVAYDYNGGQPVGWWPLDDQEGATAIDTSSNGNNGTLTNMDPANDWVDGEYGGALDFDGSNDYIDCGANSSIQLTGTGTVSLWFKATSAFSGSTGVAKFLMAGGPREFYFSASSSKLFYFLSDDATSVYSNSGSWDTNWHHAAVTSDGTIVYMYIDGVRQSQTASLGALNFFSNGSNLVIGRSSSSFPGIIDDVRIYNYALTADQIKEVMNYGSVYLK